MDFKIEDKVRFVRNPTKEDWGNCGVTPIDFLDNETIYLVGNHSYIHHTISLSEYPGKWFPSVCFELYKEEAKSEERKVKKGDIIVCNPIKSRPSGAGYSPNLCFKVTEIREGSSIIAMGGAGEGYGVYPNEYRFATKEEEKDYISKGTSFFVTNNSIEENKNIYFNGPILDQSIILRLKQFKDIYYTFNSVLSYYINKNNKWDCSTTPPDSKKEVTVTEFLRIYNINAFKLKDSKESIWEPKEGDWAVIDNLRGHRGVIGHIFQIDKINKDVLGDLWYHCTAETHCAGRSWKLNSLRKATHQEIDKAKRDSITIKTIDSKEAKISKLIEEAKIRYPIGSEVGTLSKYRPDKTVIITNHTHYSYPDGYDRNSDQIWFMGDMFNTMVYDRGKWLSSPIISTEKAIEDVFIPHYWGQQSQKSALEELYKKEKTPVKNVSLIEVRKFKSTK